MKVSELSGALLDYWVARAEIEQGIGQTTGCQIRALDEGRWVLFDSDDGGAVMIICKGFKALLQTRKELNADRFVERYSPSEMWAHAGPIIERERITVAWQPMKGEWMAGLIETEYGSMLEFRWLGFNESPLVAAMRAYVSSKFGDEVTEA
jgi:hypothetical protein